MVINQGISALLRLTIDIYNVKVSCQIGELIIKKRLSIAGTSVFEDPEFQKQFEVYCDDQITARYVLTPAFMQRLKKLNERHKGQVYIAINKYNIVIATNEGNALMRTDNSPTAMLFQKIDLAMVESVYRELIEQLQMLDTIGGRG